MEPIEAGDVVQLIDAGPVFTGCFGWVSERHEWGAIVLVPVPRADGVSDAPYRAGNNRMVRVGRLPALRSEISPGELAALRTLFLAATRAAMLNVSVNGLRQLLVDCQDGDFNLGDTGASLVDYQTGDVRPKPRAARAAAKNSRPGGQ